MKTKNIFILLFITSLLGLNSCTEKIEVELDETYTRLIVEGNLTTDTMAHKFILSKTSDYFSNQSAPKVSGASVQITDDMGNQVMLEETEEGIYKTPVDFFGQVNHQYNLRIDLQEEIGGFTSYQGSSIIPSVNPIDSIGMEFNSRFGEDGFWIVKLYATDPGGIENYYQFNVFRNGVLMTDSLDKVSFVDDKLFDGNFTFGIGVSYFNNSYENEQFKIGDTVRLQMGGITKEHFTFMANVDEATSYQNPLFGGPPANPIGNIDNGAFGYFAAYSTTYSSIILSQDNIIFTD
jgi:hypothetical protein